MNPTVGVTSAARAVGECFAVTRQPPPVGSGSGVAATPSQNCTSTFRCMPLKPSPTPLARREPVCCLGRSSRVFLRRQRDNKVCVRIVVARSCVVDADRPELLSGSSTQCVPPIGILAGLFTLLQESRSITDRPSPAPSSFRTGWEITSRSLPAVWRHVKNVPESCVSKTGHGSKMVTHRHVGNCHHN